MAGTVELVIEAPSAARLPLQKQHEGYFALSTRALSEGALYRYSIDGQGPWPDPCSRFQPQGPHGPSLLVDPDRFTWTDADWRGARLPGQVFYELHVGAFTPEGTFDAARARLPWLKNLGITLIELLPVAEFPGRWNWGYDGVQLFAPFHGYGDHEALKRFVDAAHGLGLAVILDVVYNHLGPDGNYLKRFSEHYFSSTYRTDWGEAINFDGPHAHGARELVLHNACYWLREFHLDGFRLDATQSIFDSSPRHIIAELVARSRAHAAPREILIVAENEPQRAEHLEAEAQGGFGLDAMWNDDFHHASRVALTGSRDGYLHDYRGRAQEFVSAARHGFLYQGQYYHWQKQRRGSRIRRRPAASMIHFLQNHDQVGNSFVGDRVHALAHPGRYRALTALLLLGPQTPLLFMGQEFLCSRRFMFFADHESKLAELVREGRAGFLRQFRAYAGAAAQHALRDPASQDTFEESKLDWEEAQRNESAVRLHRDLLQLRRHDPVIAAQRGDLIDGATLSEWAFVLRWIDDVHGDRLLVVNLNDQLVLDPAPEPLLASDGLRWRRCWSSEEPIYGGSGVMSPLTAEGRWELPANSATLFADDDAS